MLPAEGTRFGRDEVAYIVSFDSLEERHGAIVAEERTVILTPGACSPMQ